MHKLSHRSTRSVYVVVANSTPSSTTARCSAPQSPAAPARSSCPSGQGISRRLQEALESRSSRLV